MTILQRLGDNPKLGDVRNLAKEIKKDHALSMELWATGKFHAMMLAILIMDKKQLDQVAVDKLFLAMENHPREEREQLADWLMANQLAKDAKLTKLMGTWRQSPIALQRRIYWYAQGRLRWMGRVQPGSEELLAHIERDIMAEAAEVQWAMNFTAGWIGIFEPELRARCVAIGETTGLFKGEMVSKGCTPNYLPEFISIEAGKRNL